MVHSPGDLYEQEADHVSEHVTSTPEPAAASASTAVPGAQRHAGGQATPHGPLQMQSVAATGSGQLAAPAVVNQALVSPSHSLDAATRSFMEPQFGRDFSGVRVHSGAVADRSARALGASAYTVGSEIVFAEGQFAPRTPSGQRLLAHELTHVVQQSGAPSHRAVQRQPAGKPADTKQDDFPDTPYPEEPEVLRYAIGAYDLQKLADGTLLDQKGRLSAVGISNNAFVAGPVLSDMGPLFYVYRFESFDQKTNTHKVARGIQLGTWGTVGITKEMREKAVSVKTDKVMTVTSTGLIPRVSGAGPAPDTQHAQHWHLRRSRSQRRRTKQVCPAGSGEALQAHREQANRQR